MKSKGIISFILLALAMPAVASVIVMLIWNCIVPELFGLACITFWQALGLFVLAHLLFGSLGMGLMLLAGVCHHVFHRYEHRKVRERWANMSDEQRREFIRRRWQAGAGNFRKDKDTDSNRKGDRQDDNDGQKPE